MPAVRRLAKIERGSLGVTPKFLIDDQFERVKTSLTMASTTVAPGSRPAGMPAESNLDQVAPELSLLARVALCPSMARKATPRCARTRTPRCPGRRWNFRKFRRCVAIRDSVRIEQ